MQQNASTADMKTLSSLINKLIGDGYTEDFRVDDTGLVSGKAKKSYKPKQVHVIDFFRFEGASDPADSSILYAIETDDGTRGTLTDAYGAYSDPRVSKFMAAVEDIGKQVTKKEE